MLSHQFVLSCHPLPEGVSWGHRLEKWIGALTDGRGEHNRVREAKGGSIGREMLGVGRATPPDLGGSGCLFPWLWDHPNFQ